jgi:hypothetical protein
MINVSTLSGEPRSGEVGSEREAAVAARLGAGLGHEKRAKLLVRFVWVEAWLPASAVSMNVRRFGRAVSGRSQPA